MSSSSNPPPSCIVEQKELQLGRTPVVVIRFIDSNQVEPTPLTWVDIARYLTTSEAFRSLWNQTWANMPTDFMWKPVPIHPNFATTHPFFTVVVPSSFPRANSSAYRTYLNRLSPDERVAVFPNLSGEAQLVVPEDTGDYGHIRAFCQLAPDPLWHSFWQRTGLITQESIDNQETVWCNTHGHGVPWMHVRFDQTHKYAAFPPYGAINEQSQQQWYQSIYCSVFGSLDV